MLGSSDHEDDREEIQKRGKRHVVAPDEVPERRTNPKRAAKRNADPMAGSSSSNPKAKKARMAVARQVVTKKRTSLRTLEKRKYESLRWDQNQYEFQKETKCGQMFRTVMQQKIYEEVILALENKIAPQRAIDFEHIKKNKDKFVNIFETCDRLGLVDIMKFKHDYDEEVVMQFYATLFLEKDDGRRYFRWMTEDNEYRAPLSEFAAAIGIQMVDPGDTNFTRLHDDSLSKKPSELDECYYPSSRGVVHGHIGGLLPFFDTLHKLFRWTLFPKSGDSSHIRGYAKNLLWFILKMKKGKIDVMDLLYQEIRRSMVDRRRSLVYAPYIQAFIERVTKKFYTSGKSFKRHGIHKPAVDKPIKGVTKKALRNTAPRAAEYMDIPGSSSYESKMRQKRIIRGLRTWYCIYMEDREKRHRDRARLKQNNKMLKALIKHHKIDMQVLPGSEDEWSDLGSEYDVFAPDEEEVQSPAEYTGDDPSI